MTFLSEQDRKTATDAIRAAEAHTSGEIVTVVATHSATYFWPTLAVAALIALVVPGLVAPFVGWISSGDLFFIQIIALIILEIPLCVSRIRFALVPGAIKAAAARRLAREQFVERGLHRTKDRTGILIFVSVAEHYVEILADDGIHMKVAGGTWRGIVDRFITDVRNDRIPEGFQLAVKSVGEILAQHFPSEAKNPNELPDRLYVI